MGLSRSPAELAVKMTRASAGIAQVPAKSIAAGALMVKTSIITFTRPATGGDMRLSGVGKKGALLGARYTTNLSEGVARAAVFATGPFQLVERDTRAGIRPRKRRGGRGKNRFIGPIEGYYHPGTKGKHPFEKGVDAALPLVPRVMQTATLSTLAALF